ncbi:MAG: DUF3352 domain-containing protein [Oculatellaceae cyanobacterium Prado106]|jgi:hypothetical protein|nr:DUF3352 domain-containing protein [Oculatellaceae cyanobacterium Prado106]
MMKNLFKSKLGLWLPLGSAIALAGGGALVWWNLQQRTPVEGLPIGSEVLPEDTAVTIALSTNEAQWRQLQQFGNRVTKAQVNEFVRKTSDRLFTQNGLDYERDIKPWVGSEITLAFLASPAPEGDSAPSAIVPQAPLDTPPLFMLPIANPAKAQELLSKPRTGADQEAVERDYKGLKIREVHGKEGPAYAATVIDNRLVVLSPDAKSVERVIDTLKGEAPLSRVSEYSQAFKQLKPIAPLVRLYSNIPKAETLAAGNPLQPVPPQSFSFLKNNQGLVGTITLEPEGLQMQGVSWLPSDSKVRYRVENKAQRMASLLPSETIMMVSGGNLRQFWEENNPPTAGQNNPAPRSTVSGLSPIESGLENMTGLQMEKDFLPWMNGEFALGLVAGSAQDTSAPTAGLMLLSQASDRRAAEQTLKRLDEVMQSRYQFQVNPTEANGQPVVNWVSPFTALKASHGWLDGNVAYLAVGPGVSGLVNPAPGKTLAETELFRQATATTLESTNGHVFINFEPIANASTALPLPILPPENQAVLSAMRAIGVTTAIQDNRTFRFDTQFILRKSSPLDDAPLPASPSPSASPAPASP